MQIKKASVRWIVIGVCVVAVCFVFIIGNSYNLRIQERLLASVPLGSPVTSLRSIRNCDAVRGGSVMQWRPEAVGTPPLSDIQIRLDGEIIETEFGKFMQKDLGDYDHWDPSGEAEKHFTGEIVFYVERGLSYLVIGFMFVDGQLVKKDWGFLPG